MALSAPDGTGAGRRTTLVLLPGMDGTGELFAEFAARLQDAFDVVIVRYPASKALGYAALTELARAALPQEGPYLILGESFSGPIAVALAADASPRLQGLVLCCSFVRNPHPWLGGLRVLVPWLPVPAALLGGLTRGLLGPGASASLRRRVRAAVAQPSPAAWRARLQAVLSIDSTECLAACRVPVLYLRAAQDWLVPRSALAVVKRHAAGVLTVTFPGGHFLLQCHAEQAAAAVRAFAHPAPGAGSPPPA
jgi:pimeloyl-[acyl-carrier protein] methyl ester esterase